jgi:hypothetical protein
MQQLVGIRVQHENPIVPQLDGDLGVIVFDGFGGNSAFIDPAVAQRASYRREPSAGGRCWKDSADRTGKGALGIALVGEGTQPTHQALDGRKREICGVGSPQTKLKGQAKRHSNLIWS